MQKEGAGPPGPRGTNHFVMRGRTMTMLNQNNPKINKASDFNQMMENL